MQMYIEKKVEEVLYLKNEIFAGATNGTDYSLQEAADLVRERWLEYVDRASKIEDDIIKSLPILNSVQVDVNRTISRIAEAEFTPMWSDRWPRWESHWANHLDSLRATLELYRDDPIEFDRSLRMGTIGRMASDPEEAEAIRYNELDKVRKHIRRLLERRTPVAFPIVYAWMKNLRFTCEHWEELAQDWEDDAGLDLCEDVLTTFLLDLDTSLQKAVPELADVVAGARRKRDKMHRNVSNEWANEFKRRFENVTGGLHGEILKPVKHSKAEISRRIGSEDSWFIQRIYERMNGKVTRWSVADPEAAVSYIFNKANIPMVKVFYEMMGGVDSKAARAVRLCWMKILVENSTIGDEWHLEKIREVRNQFSETDFNAQLGEDLSAKFIELLIDSVAVTDLFNETGGLVSLQSALDELRDKLIVKLTGIDRSHLLTKEIVHFYAASCVKGRITKDDFFKQSRRILKKSKYFYDSVLWEGTANNYIKEWTGFTPDRILH